MTKMRRKIAGELKKERKQMAEQNKQKQVKLPKYAEQTLAEKARAKKRATRETADLSVFMHGLSIQQISCLDFSKQVLQNLCRNLRVTPSQKAPVMARNLARHVCFRDGLNLELASLDFSPVNFWNYSSEKALICKALQIDPAQTDDLGAAVISKGSIGLAIALDTITPTQLSARLKEKMALIEAIRKRGSLSPPAALFEEPGEEKEQVGAEEGLSSASDAAVGPKAKKIELISALMDAYQLASDETLQTPILEETRALREKAITALRARQSADMVAVLG
jgi:hypothetical protein